MLFSFFITHKGVSGDFSKILTTLRRFLKNIWKLRFLTKVNRFTEIAENYRRLPSSSKKDPKMFDHTPANLSAVKERKWYKNYITHVRIKMIFSHEGYRFWVFFGQPNISLSQRVLGLLWKGQWMHMSEWVRNVWLELLYMHHRSHRAFTVFLQRVRSSVAFLIWL